MTRGTTGSTETRPPVAEASELVACLDALAAGPGDARAVATLVAAQRAKRLLSLRAVTAFSGTTRARDALARIADAERAAPDAVGRVLDHPYTGVWVHTALRRRSSDPASPLVTDADIERLELVAKSAEFASRGVGPGGDPTDPGNPHPPTPSGYLPRRGLQTDAAGFLPNRRARFGPTCLHIEELDPCRDCHQWPVSPRMGRPEADDFASRIGRAWHAIEAAAPEYAEPTARILGTVTPLLPQPGRDVSSAARHAFGAVAVAPCADPHALAALIVHEVQHVKLGALLDLVPLHESGGPVRHVAPWREDLRPVGALLQGAYAHLALTHFHRDDPEHHARYRRQTADALATLEHSGELTPAGLRFVTGMRDGLD
ncbi:aKG-HExxH-type peptide beta-hydroxylase [Yinghuangia seranimata]|uniref:aKG-HExxH-type peptide beta-hydroxylase n=1 Tax=Yinghuangia seranimata TaxID=408067 RepID=UPI00248AEA7C|nr:HEXXH motif-containing putative peptide modification protein [Yinghuangia seranimata]MDI2125321.1 HEXXH motif-containing putative peptide modification protein [Yinghuangia seranimata]